MTTELQMRQQIEARLRSQPNFKQNGKWMNCSSPLREDHNPSFGYETDGGYHDLGNGESGSAFDLARKLGIDIPESSEQVITINKVDLDQQYADLEDYAIEHGVTREVFARAGWRDGVKRDAQGIERPALIFKTHQGTEERWRFLTGKQKYGHRPDYPFTLYGLAGAVNIVSQPDSKIDGLIICNGEASTVVAQHYGLPSFCKTSGEAELPKNLLDMLKGQWQGKLYIAFDCDTAGRNAAKKVQVQWENSVIIDLALKDKQDLADFCKLHTDQSPREFNKLIQKADGYKGVRSDVLAREYIKFLYEDDPKPSVGIPLYWPFPSFHQYEGMFEMCDTGKMLEIVGSSGTGKTAFAESVTDCILRDGGDICWLGLEWKPREMIARRVARYGGLKITEVTKYKRWQEDWARGVPENKRKGFKPSDESLQKSADIAAKAARWAGRSYHIPWSRYIEDVLDDMTHNVVKARSEGRAMMLAVFDYVQLMTTRERFSGQYERYEIVLEKMKAWVENNSMVALVVSQVTKNSSHESNHINGKAIGKEDSQFIRSDKFNGVITLNFDYYEKDGELVMMEQNGYAMIQKNSGGQAPRKVKLISKLDRHGWFDPKIASIQTSNSIV